MSSSSPYKRWHHTHTFTEENGGTRCDDVVEYAPPGGPLALINKLVVQRDVEKIFLHRAKILRDVWIRARSVSEWRGSSTTHAWSLANASCSDKTTLLLIHAAATLYMAGLIWFVQLVHYPLMANVGKRLFDLPTTARTQDNAGRRARCLSNWAAPVPCVADTGRRRSLACLDRPDTCWRLVG